MINQTKTNKYKLSQIKNIIQPKLYYLLLLVISSSVYIKLSTTTCEKRNNIFCIKIKKNNN
jgi:hypothetical protein